MARWPSGPPFLPNVWCRHQRPSPRHGHRQRLTDVLAAAIARGWDPGVHVDEALWGGGIGRSRSPLAVRAMCSAPQSMCPAQTSAAAAEAERGEPSLQAAGEDHEVGPGDLRPYLLDRQQPACLVEFTLSGQVERGDRCARPPPPRPSLIRCGAVPGHADGGRRPSGRPPLRESHRPWRRPPGRGWRTLRRSEVRPLGSAAGVRCRTQSSWSGPLPDFGGRVPGSSFGMSCGAASSPGHCVGCQSCLFALLPHADYGHGLWAAHLRGHGASIAVLRDEAGKVVRGSRRSAPAREGHASRR